LATGLLSSASIADLYAVASFGGNNSIVAIIAGGMNNTNEIAITAGTNYDKLDKIQCLAAFTPTPFIVKVNANGRNITVTAVNYSSPVVDVDPTSSSQPEWRGRLQQAVLWEITRMSQRNIDLYSSLIGDGFQLNTNERAHVTNWSQATDQQLLDAIEESFEAAIDDTLLFIASAQYIVGPSGNRKDTDVIMNVAAVTVGSPKGIWSIFAFNMVLLILCLA
jgi:hypothetical protein